MVAVLKLLCLLFLAVALIGCNSAQQHAAATAPPPQVKPFSASTEATQPKRGVMMPMQMGMTRNPNSTQPIQVGSK